MTRTPPRRSALQPIELLREIGHERIRVSIDPLAANCVVDIRTLTPLTKSSDIWCPTARGVRIDLRLVPALIRALKQAEAKAHDLK